MTFMEQQHHDSAPDADLNQSRRTGDMRFSRLMPPPQWQSLPAPIQQRFSSGLAPGEAVLYHGHILETRLSGSGLVLASLARLVGSPLPYRQGATGIAVVCVTEADNNATQCWTRLYEQKGHFPHTIHSMKRFRGSTGLEEYIGFGIGMALRVSAQNRALVFESDFYFLELWGFKLRLPAFLSPGKMRITHKQEKSGQFSFSLLLSHSLLGQLIYQYVLFNDNTT